MKTIFYILMAGTLIAGQGCKKCTDAELQQKITNLNNQEATELQNPNLTSAQVTAIGKKYDRYRADATSSCK